jgi:hypothetical protein
MQLAYAAALFVFALYVFVVRVAIDRFLGPQEPHKTGPNRK